MVARSWMIWVARLGARPIRTARGLATTSRVGGRVSAGWARGCEDAVRRGGVVGARREPGAGRGVGSGRGCGVGRLPDCQSRMRSSRQENRLARAARIRACREAGSHRGGWAVAVVARRLTNWSARGGGLSNTQALYITYTVAAKVFLDVGVVQCQSALHPTEWWGGAAWPPSGSPRCTGEE